MNDCKSHPTIKESVFKRAIKKTSDKSFLREAAIIPATHHERWGGLGYPYGLKELEIPLTGRLMAIADVYGVLVLERSYKEALLHEKAVGIIREESGKHFDPVLVEIFETNTCRFESINKDLGSGQAQ